MSFTGIIKLATSVNDSALIIEINRAQYLLPKVHKMFNSLLLQTIP